MTIIREIIGHVEHQIEARSKELRLFEVYNKLDARSTAMLNGKKFKVNYASHCTGALNGSLMEHSVETVYPASMPKNI